MTNKLLNKAKTDKKDEFYTQLDTIGAEMPHYARHFADKVVYLNCDDPRESKFFEYFVENFNQLGLKKVIVSCFKAQTNNLFDIGDNESAVWTEYSGTPAYSGSIVDILGSIGLNEFKGDGDFRSPEAVDLLAQADIVITNPPFSLFRTLIAQLVEHDKKFILLGTISATTYVDVFPLIRDGKLWPGTKFNTAVEFRLSDDYETFGRQDDEGNKYAKVAGITWWTNLEHDNGYRELDELKYVAEDYVTYDNYDAIEIATIKQLPTDYTGVMGVPITYLGYYNPNEYEMLGSNRGVNQDDLGIYGRSAYVNGKEVFKRLFIRRKRVD